MSSTPIAEGNNMISEYRFDDLISHCLVIVNGYTNLLFVEDTRNVSPVPNSDNVMVSWASERIPLIRGSALGLVATHVRIQIAINAVFGKDDVLCVGKSPQTVPIVFIYTKPDGSEFSVPRTLEFKDQYFYRFTD